METLETALWAFHLIIVIALVVTILLQRSEGGALGMGGGGADSMMSGRSAGDVLTKVTTGLAILFFLTSITLAYLAKLDVTTSSILSDSGTTEGVSVPVSEADKAAAEKGLGDLLNQVAPSSNEPSVPVSQ